jgi:hypothetical protein
MRTRRCSTGLAVLLLTTACASGGGGRRPPADAHAGSAAAGTKRVMPRATMNDPYGDSFVGTAAERGRIVDEYLADNSFAGPMELYIAASTAEQLGRHEDAAFLFYAAQLRKHFEYERRGITGNPRSEQYLAFLNHTIGMRVNPVVGRHPKAFIAAIARNERWEIIPAPRASLDELGANPEFKVPASDWPVLARELKEEFMSVFGRKFAVLLADPEFVEAFQYVRAYNMFEIPRSEDAGRKYETYLARIRAMEKERFPQSTPLF